ncbi:hypothetical protein HRbin06_00727 [archaeon HR06]|nr:hypothetical protein HRbin06_00727 [archaeon HR06]
MFLESLKERALEMNSREFSEVIIKLIELLAKERTKDKPFTVKKDLIILKPEGKFLILGDIHGDLLTLLLILNKEREFFSKGEKWYMIFLGDYGDRGLYSPEVYYIIASLKLTYPENIILLRGNHEGPEDLPFYPFDLPQQLIKKFGSKAEDLLSLLKKLFEYLYLSVYIEGYYLLLHGGIPVKANSIEDIALAKVKHPKLTFLEEILWNDPVENLEDSLPSPRGAGRIFGERITERFLNLIKAKNLIRGHEPCNGYKINHKGKILTLFSCKGIYFNSYAGYLKLDLPFDHKNLTNCIVRI